MLLAVFGAAGLLFAALTLFGEVCHDRRQGHYRRRIIPKCEAFCTTGDTSRLRRRAGSARGPDARRGSGPDRAGNGPSSPVARGKSAERHVPLGTLNLHPRHTRVATPGQAPAIRCRPAGSSPRPRPRSAGDQRSVCRVARAGLARDLPWRCRRQDDRGGRFLFLRQKSGNRAHEVTLGSSFFCPGPCRRFRGERHDRMPAIS